MARSFRSRRYRPRLRRRYRIKKSSLSKIKKDILKCNFPTKVKFMGLTERKVMFLTYQKSVEFSEKNKDRALYLIPSVATNWKSIIGDFKTASTGESARLPNWDKICVLGIYIKVQPNFNMFQGGEGKTIRPVKCFYAMDSCPAGDMVDFDKQLFPYKQVFTFNSNEAFTIYVPAPTTMDFNTSVVHRSKTWWSLAGIKTPDDGEVFKGEMSEDGQDGQESEVENEEGEEEYSAILKTAGDVFHCGRLAFQCEGDAAFNVTINYKVALKG